MRIRMLVCHAGRGFVRNVGDEVELAEAEAQRLIAAGHAEPCASAPKRKAGRGRRVAVNPKAIAPETTDNPEGA